MNKRELAIRRCVRCLRARLNNDDESLIHSQCSRRILDHLSAESRKRIRAIDDSYNDDALDLFYCESIKQYKLTFDDLLLTFDEDEKQQLLNYLRSLIVFLR